MIRVVVAEDSLTVRRLLVAILESDPAITVVGEATTGVEAVALAQRLRPDLITMDIHMPQMDGLAATQEIMIHAPTPILIVSSSISGRDVESSFDALRAGALMVLRKPDNPSIARFNGQRDEFVAMTKAMAAVKVVRRWAAKAPPRQHDAHRDSRGDATARPRGTVRVVAIAASTGGPGVLQQILSELPRRFAVPILVVQHIATGFASGLADWLATTSALRVTVAQSGDRALPRTVYLAPDDHHLGIGADGRLVVAGSPAVAGFRPSASFLFEAAARAYGTAAVGVILTGMGQDGVEGLKAVKAAGGVVLAQDEATSVVFGMPREAIRVGVVDDVLTPTAIAARLGALVGEE